MPSSYHCPGCKSKDVIEYAEYIECTSCHFEFFKEGLDEIDDENQVSIQELDVIIGVFDELVREYGRDKLSRSLDEDDSEDNEYELD